MPTNFQLLNDIQRSWKTQTQLSVRDVVASFRLAAYRTWRFRTHHYTVHDTSIPKVASIVRSEATRFIGRLFREYAPVLCHSKCVIHAHIARIHNPPQMKIVVATPIFLAVVIFFNVRGLTPPAWERRLGCNQRDFTTLRILVHSSAPSPFRLVSELSQTRNAQSQGSLRQ